MKRLLVAAHESGVGTKEPSSECLPMSVDWGAADLLAARSSMAGEGPRVAPGC
jgi:hypothetical protein